MWMKRTMVSPKTAVKTHREIDIGALNLPVTKPASALYHTSAVCSHTPCTRRSHCITSMAALSPNSPRRDHVALCVAADSQCIAKSRLHLDEIRRHRLHARPGLSGALLVGASIACALAIHWACPPSVCITSKDTCSRPCFPTRTEFRLWRCSSPADIRN